MMKAKISKSHITHRCSFSSSNLPPILPYKIFLFLQSFYIWATNPVNEAVKTHVHIVRNLFKVKAKKKKETKILKDHMNSFHKTTCTKVSCSIIFVFFRSVLCASHSKFFFPLVNLILILDVHTAQNDEIYCLYYQ